MSEDKKEQSITHKLQALSQREKSSTQELRTDYLLERLAARLAVDPKLGSEVVFKGGFVSRRVYQSGRFTQDIDISLAAKEFLLEEISKAASKDLSDGTWYSFRDIVPLRQQTGEGGTRLRFFSGIGEKPQEFGRATTVGVDVSHSPVPYSAKTKTPSLLEGSALAWQVCACEVTVADKLHSLLSRGEENTRARDVYDIYKLARQCDPALLQAALKRVFEDCKQELPKDIPEILRKADTTRLRKAWETALSYLGPAIGFEAAWDGMVHAVESKLTLTSLTPERKLLAEEERKLLKERSKLGFVGNDKDAHYGLGGYPEDSTPAQKKIQKELEEKLRVARENLVKETKEQSLNRDQTLVIKKRK